jgi:hypothetical protein
LKIVKVIGASIGVIVCFFYLGCGGGVQMAEAAHQTVTPLVIATKILPSAVVGTPYVAVLDATGGTLGYTWKLSSGTLPSGLTLAATTGVISGTPSAPGNFSFTVNVTDASKPNQKMSTSMSISVAALPLAIVPPSLPAAAYGQAYAQTLQATGGVPTYKWSITSGSLPSGLTLSSGGLISGTPAASGTSTFTVTVQDSGSSIQKASIGITIIVAQAQLQIIPATLPAVVAGTSYAQTLQATGGTPSYRWSVISGSLPAGLSLSPTGTISGVASTIGSSTFTASVSDSSVPTQTASAAFNITVSATKLAITASALPSVAIGSSYSQSFKAAGGTAPYTWSISSGSLPAGLSLSPSTGTISGVPSVSGTVKFTVTVSDSSSPAQTASAATSIVVSPTTLAIVASALPSTQVGTPYSQALKASGGTTSYTWSITSGKLPSGLTLTPSTGTISGVPTSSGVANFTATVVDSSSPAQAASASTTVAVSPVLLTITSSALSSVSVGSPYSQALQATGGATPYKWVITSGSLPSGLTLSPSTGTISGTPSLSGNSTFTVTVTDNSSPVQITSTTTSLAVTPSTSVAPTPLSITTWQMASGTVGTGYSQALQASGGTAPYTWLFSAGQLPAGLSISTAGVISGTPTTGGTFNFTVTANDSGSPAQTQSATLAMTLTSPQMLFVPPPVPGTPSLSLYPTSAVAPRGSYQSVTAIMNGVNDKTVTWTTDGGTIVGTNPCVVNEPCTVALTTTTPGTYHLTATSNATGSVTAASTITFTGSPTPVSGHPRLLLTSAMLPGLRAKANSSNPLFAAVKTNAVNLLTADSAQWSWTCNGGTGLPATDQTGNLGTEYDANLYAFMALVDPSDGAYKWGCYAHDMWVYLTVHVVSQSVQIGQDRFRYTGKALALTTDWLMGSNLLNPTEQAQSAAFLHYLGKQVLSNSNGGNPPVTGYNSSAQFNTGGEYDLVGQRAMGNNYMEGKFLIGAALGITFNDSTGEDPTLTNCAGGRYAVCPDYSANSLRAYWNYFTGSYLYKQYAHLEDPSVSWPAYQATYNNLPSQPVCQSSYSSTTPVPCFGDGRGGGPSEGNGYGYSVYSVRYAMNAIYTAGMDDPLLYGPQMSLVSSSWWDLNANAELTYLAGQYGSTGPQRWAYFSNGDTASYSRFPYFYPQLAADMTFASYFGRNTDALLWPILNTAAYGVSNFMTSDLVNSTSESLAIDMFISLPSGDPTANPPADPRPSLPADNYIAGNQNLFARTGWTTNDTTFATYCNNALASHEHEYCGRFDIFSKGEYITKGQVVFDDDYNGAMADSTNSNLASYLNNPSSTQCASSGGSWCYVWQSVQFGGEFDGGSQQGSVTLNHSELPGHVAFNADLANVYNGSAQNSHVSTYTGVDAASRSLVYLRGTNQVAYYDRGSTTGNAWDKSLYLTSTGPLKISGNTASWTTRSTAQRAYLTSLLPVGASVADIGLDPLASTYQLANDWEPFSRVKIDAGNIASTRFLTVLEWGSAGASKSTTTLIQSTSGQNFDGALVGSSLVMFMRTWPATLTNVTYPASGATTHYISDLTPNTSYTISGTGAPTSATTDTAGVLTFTAAGTGNITITGK